MPITKSDSSSQPIAPNTKALFPFLVFLALFLGTGIALTLQGVEFAFYQLPASIAILPAIILALAVGGEAFEQKVTTFIRGVGDHNIITMCLIYLLAGAFASVAKATGSVDASVQLGLSVLPEYLLLPGVFIIAAFISTAMGTSMGTIAAMAPIALGISDSSAISAPLMAGSLISGAIFGDNLSIISDTTIASTKTQGAELKDKFRVNFRFSAVAAIISISIFFVLGDAAPVNPIENTNPIGLLPYIVILVLALLGVNVFVVLTTGIVLAALIGWITNGYQLTSWVSDINQGFSSMQDIFILSLLIGGLSELIRTRGGLAALTEKVYRLSRKLCADEQKSASIGIASLAFFANFFTANNTVSIILAAKTAKSLASEHNIKPAYSASLLDIFSCVCQGILPYGAQALLLGASFSISPLAVVSYAFYPMILFFCASVFFFKKRQDN
jgi:Na+/H+ antiporter NhaC